MIEEAKKEHVKQKLQSCTDSKSIYKVVNGLLNNSTRVLPAHECAETLSNDFAMFFQEKVNQIYSGLKEEQSGIVKSDVYEGSVTCRLSNYDLVSEEDVNKLICKTASKSCVLDPLPTWLLKSNSDVFVPIITKVINLSLSSGIFPSNLKHAILNPLIKKQSLNPNELKNYRPVANIKFMSKLIEKHVVNTISAHMLKYNLGEEHQSAYCAARSTETALVKVKDEIMNHIHNQKGVFLVMLDLSAAFDTVNHNILFNRLESEIGLTGKALDWFKSYFTGRTTCVLINDNFSNSLDMEYGLPQGSIVGPKSFTIYTIPIGRIIKQHNLSYHIYADDIQILTSFIPSDSSSIQSSLSALELCISDISKWMTENMLKLNSDKTEFFVATSHHFKKLMPNVHLQIGDETISPSENIRNLGVIFDDVMSMSAHVTSLSCNLTYHLRNITRIRRFMDLDTCNNIVRSLILSRLDYGNALLLGSNVSSISRLQKFQNWAAKLIFCAAKQDHATPFLKKLHWLPVKERIYFKILLYVYKCLNGHAPDYLSCCLSPYSQSRPGLCSALDTTRLAQPNISSKLLWSAANKAFSLAAPALWNQLPIAIRSSNSLYTFKKALKSHLYPQ